MASYNSFLQWNLQSYRSKFEELKCLLNIHTPICVCLQETMIGENQTTYPPSQYTLVKSRPVRQDGHERGAAILVHRRFNHEEIPLQTHLQASAVTIYLDRKYTICSLYLPHHPIEQIELENLIQQLPTPFMLLGDLNARSNLWGCPTTDVRGRKIENILYNQAISVLNDGRPTHYHVQTGSYSTIDLSICSSDIFDDLNYEVLDSTFSSDHFPIKISWNDPPLLVSTVPRYKTELGRWREFERLTEVGAVDASMDVEQLLQHIQSTIISAADQTIPRTSGNYQKPPVPWMNNICKAAKRDRNRAERALRRNFSIENKIRYNRAKAFCRYTMKQQRLISFQNYVQSINQRTTLHQVWKKVRKIEGKFSPNPTPVVQDQNGQLHSAPEEVANLFAEHFANISSPTNYTPEFQHYKGQQESRHLNFNTRERLDYNEPISMQELKSALSSTLESSPGEDQITYSMIKHAHPTLLEHLLHLYNKIFLEHVFPAAWLIAIIIAILKPAKNHKILNNYRPISLIDVPCKLLEKIINNRLIWVLETQGFIAPDQSGFRKNRSTSDHLVRLETDLRAALNQRLHTIAIFFDLQKAYDTAWRYGVLRALYDFGIRGSLPIYLSNFLSNRSLKVRVSSAYSRTVPVLEGIPQGSVLSCTCFLIAINSITANIPRSVRSLLYVDDLTIYASGSTTNTIERQLQLALNSLQQWSAKTGFQFSVVKTEAMHVCRKHGCPKLAPNLTLNNQPIKCSDSIKFLGLILDNTLSWKPQINALKAKCNKGLNLLKKLAHTKWGSDAPTMVRLYIMLIKPQLEYGIEAFISAADSYLKTINTIQNSALRISTGAFRSTPITSLHALTSVPPRNYASHFKQLNLYLRFVVNPTHPLHEAIIDQEDLDEMAIVDQTPPKSFLSRAHVLHLLYSLDTSRILLETFPTHPPWKINCISTCLQICQYNKRDTPDHTLKGAFNDHLMTHHGSYHIYTDGSKTADGVGCACYSATWTDKSRLPDMASIFTAELMAIRQAITYSENNLHQNKITIFSDSKSAIQSISSRSPNPIVINIQDLIIPSTKQYTFCWVPSHVGVIGNEHADSLARNSIDTLDRTPYSLPRSDIRHNLKRLIRKAWQDSWTNERNNKLREILPTIPPKYIDNHPRSWSVKMFRLKTGHTNLSHSYLMSGSEPPYCEDCIVPLTLKHVLTECPSHAQHRLLFGCPGPPTMLDIFKSDNCKVGGPLYQFLHRINIFDSI